MMSVIYAKLFLKTTTELDGECTLSFGGTSAATPMVSGIIALVLQAKYASTFICIGFRFKLIQGVSDNAMAH